MQKLVQRTEPERFFLFSRVTYHTPFQFFSALRDFFPEIFFPQRVPPSIFSSFCDRMDDGKSQRVPPSIFWCFATKPPQLRQKCWQFRKCPPFSALARAPARHSVHFLSMFFRKFFFVKFSIFEYCKREYLTLGSLFAIFEPWIWRRLGPVPACLLFQGNIHIRTCLKGPPFRFFRYCATFFRNILSPKGPPFIFYFFNVTYNTGRASRVPPLDFFSAMCDFSKIF